MNVKLPVKEGDPLDFLDAAHILRKFCPPIVKFERTSIIVFSPTDSAEP
jgi:hypothetical protein